VPTESYVRIDLGRVNDLVAESAQASGFGVERREVVFVDA
jgi:hypothetical protein